MKNTNKLNLKIGFLLIFFLLLTISSGNVFAKAKNTETINNLSTYNPLKKNKKSLSPKREETEKCAAPQIKPSEADYFSLSQCKPVRKLQTVEIKSEIEQRIKEPSEAKRKKNFIDKNSAPTDERFHWKAALIESGIFLGIQHGFRMTQPKTTRELGGPFFRDWAKSIKNLRGWNDADNSFTNNIAHPLQGGLTGRIFVNNSDRAKRLEFGKSKKYWTSRAKAMAWSAVWSTQFEFGPLSEASIGNVGLREKNGHSTQAWTDLVMTPVAGTGVLVGEDAIDKYILKNWLERKAGGRMTIKIKILRSVLTPTTGFSNLLRGKAPWKRDNR